ncbi:MULTISPECIES: FAD binding domain-containing protein [Agrobacterium]|uniref:FAD binding domain-containing protein n=1 Tax=Agrobacterium TaxID=357 RepID=UPI00230168CC|nr:MULTISPECIES: FAD-dependent monooxygenase [Agrobacterium]MDA5639559.1 FAD-dependent monooxygenase [Agrobacterium sp. ST15.13.013]MDA6999546.1 FAD-dependent monooxygenase [Agrobacterium salinitolerans]
MKPLRIRVVGGSLAGLFTAILLQNDGHDVVVYERSHSGLAGRGAGLVPQEEVFHILRMIGADHAANVGVMARERIYFNADGSVAQNLSMPQMQISWDFLYSEVLARLEKGRYQTGRAAEAVIDADDGATIIFADGSSEKADLVIGADGLGSVVRATLNEDWHNRYAGYVAWRGLLPENKLPPGASILLDRFAFYVKSGVHILGYLVPGPKGETTPGQRRYNWVWYRPINEAGLASTLTDRDGTAYAYSLPRGALATSRVEALHADAAAVLPTPFALAVQAENTPSIQAIFDYAADRMVGQSVALVGDAAFVARPHTAMGVSKAAADAVSLQRNVVRAGSLREGLAAYQSERMLIDGQTVAYGKRLGDSAL